MVDTTWLSGSVQTAFNRAFRAVLALPHALVMLTQEGFVLAAPEWEALGLSGSHGQRWTIRAFFVTSSSSNLGSSSGPGSELLLDDGLNVSL